MREKQEIRNRMKGLLAKMSAHEVGVLSNYNIVPKFLKLPEVQRADSFFVYVSSGQEVQTIGLLETLLVKGKIVTVPKIVGKGDMDPFRIEKLGDLVEGKYRILTSKQEEPYRRGLAVCVAPGIAYTMNLERLGSGGGFYDRFFKVYPGMYRVAFAYDMQIIDKVPMEPHDEMVDMIITEKRIIH